MNRVRRPLRRLSRAVLAVMAVVVLGGCLSMSTAAGGRTKPADAAAPAAASVTPSGEAMPTGSLSNGWRQVLSADFDGSTLGHCWGAYKGVPSSSPTALWDPGHIKVANGIAQLQTYRDPHHGNRWVTAGMSSAGCVSQAYGEYEIRFRMTKADGVKYAILLFPSSGNWPCDGEIDFGEDGGGNRTATTLTNIYCHSNGSEAQLPQHTIHADFSKWQTIGLRWTPDKLVWMLNGRTVGTIDSPHVSSHRMQFDVQTETNSNCSLKFSTCLDSHTPARVDMDIDWAVAWARPQG